ALPAFFILALMRTEIGRALRHGDDWLPNHHVKKIFTACPCPDGVLEQEKTALAGKRSPVC
ncbi:MAG: hypothetical protein MR770_02775, partial [Desulfovibrio piger]|nr:hypothetical protein [Desulfovibrio piger]